MIQKHLTLFKSLEAHQSSNMCRSWLKGLTSLLKIPKYSIGIFVCHPFWSTAAYLLCIKRSHSHIWGSALTSEVRVFFFLQKISCHTGPESGLQSIFLLYYDRPILLTVIHAKDVIKCIFYTFLARVSPSLLLFWHNKNIRFICQ